MPVELPGSDARWRCALCGNLTRFDVTRVVRSKDFVHVDLAGDSRVEQREVLAETVEHVVCRWCGAVDNVICEPRPAVSGPRPPSG